MRGPGGCEVCEGRQARTGSMRRGGLCHKVCAGHHRGHGAARPPGRGSRGRGAVAVPRSGRAPRRRALTGLCGGVLGAALEGEAEQQLVAAAARAHQDNADGAGALPHPGPARRKSRPAAGFRFRRYPGPGRGCGCRRGGAAGVGAGPRVRGFPTAGRAQPEPAPRTPTALFPQCRPVSPVQNSVPTSTQCLQFRPAPYTPTVLCPQYNPVSPVQASTSHTHSPIPAVRPSASSSDQHLTPCPGLNQPCASSSDRYFPMDTIPHSMHPQFTKVLQVLTSNSLQLSPVPPAPPVQPCTPAGAQWPPGHPRHGPGPGALVQELPEAWSAHLCFFPLVSLGHSSPFSQFSH